MLVKDIVRFSKEKFFNGAVQTEWFYDATKEKQVAESYVFHGPKYFGVSEADLELGGHKLIDTASFAANIADKLCSDAPENNFVMTIAGYGAGKSHLAVSLAALFSDEKDVSDLVLSNIKAADTSIADMIAAKKKQKNLVIVLNGMNNFNLDAEVLKCVRLTLAKNGLNDDVLKNITKAYDISRQFVEKTFYMCQDSFEKRAKLADCYKEGDSLRAFLLSNIEDPTVTEIVNDVYVELTGDSISWDRGLSAGDIISELQVQLCGNGKPFNKILILFDEFGRYIEYAAANPVIAGEAALQQMFEAVQSANGGIIFVGFVQSELDAYLSRIEKTSNIIRYVGRYKASENLFLSSNFETVLANLIYKPDEEAFSNIMEELLLKYGNFYGNLRRALLRWNRSSVRKSVWTDESLYDSVIQRGCYPLHPITVWLLSNMSNWMQQRSAITFVAEMVDRISDAEIKGTWLPWIYPVNIIDSGIYNEMLNSEEKGLIQSQYCMLYRDIIVKVGDKLNDKELKTLKAILVNNIGRFSFIDRNDAINALHLCSNLSVEDTEMAINSLENLHGVVSFDENSNTFDLIAEANGINEFKRVLRRYNATAKETSISDCDDALRKELNLNSDIETSFAHIHNISSLEWRFKRTLIDSSDITEYFINSKKREMEAEYSGEQARGELIFAYCAKSADKEINRLANIYKNTDLQHYPIIIIFLDDNEGEIIRALKIKNLLNRFSTDDYERFKKHIVNLHKSKDKKIIKQFNALVQERNIITESGLVHYQGRLNALCSAKFEELYSRALPFMFDGFENKTPTAARRYLANICIKMADRSLTNIQSYNALSTDEKNRIKACLTTGVATSWQGYTNDCRFVPPINDVALEIFKELDAAIDNNTRSVLQLFSKYTKVPYGLNINAVALFLFYYLAVKDKQVLCYYNDRKMQSSIVSDKIFKNNRLQPKELLSIKIRINTDIDVDQVKDICNEILSCTLVEECPKYKSKLKTVISQEGISSENAVLVATATSRVDDGMALRRSIYDKLDKGQNILAEVRANFSLPKFIRIYNYCNAATGIIDSNLPFVYSDYYRQAMEKLKVDADQLLIKRGLTAISEFTCAITELTQFQSLCQKIATSFRENGHEDFAEAIEKRSIEVEEYLLAKQKYEASLVELKKDLAMSADSSSLGYSSCYKALEKIMGWQRFFENITDMPDQLYSQQKNRIDDCINALKTRLSIISDECSELICKAFEADNVTTLSNLKDDMSNMIEIGISNEDAAKVNACIRKIDNTIDMVEKLPNTIDELREMQLDSRFREAEVIVETVASELNRKLEFFINDQAKWVEKYLEPIESEIDTKNVDDCSTWIDKTSKLPEYLDSKTVEKYKKAKGRVENQLHKSKVQGVLVLYNKLSDSEKEEFLQVIRNDKKN